MDMVVFNEVKERGKESKQQQAEFHYHPFSPRG